MGKSSGPAVEWRGALELAGFNVNVALYKPRKQTRVPSFKQLGPDGKPPIRKMYKASDPKTEITGDDLDKGVETAPNVFRALPDTVVEQINAGTRTKTLKPDHFAPRSTVDFTKSLMTYAVRPDEKVPGAQQAVNVVWNGLVAGDLVYASRYAGGSSMDNVVVIWADEDGLWATMFPFAHELYPQPGQFDSETGEPFFSRDEKAAALFGQVVEKMYDVKPAFDYESFESEYLARRMKAIDAFLNGDEVEVEPDVEETTVPDLMAVLEASLAEANA